VFAGHVGAGLAIARGERRVNAAWFVAAALLLDLALWAFVLLGWEAVVLPADFASRHQPDFVFPLSHGLVAGLAWSIVFGAAAGMVSRRPRAGVLVGLAVFSHWVLDAIVHKPELPAAGEHSMRIGLSLWDALPWALLLESLIVVVGTWLLLGDSLLSGPRKASLGIVVLIVLVSTIVGMTIAPPPPSVTAMAVSSLLTLLVVCGLVAWIDSKRLRA
jgi:hypothetical protein